MTGDELRAMPNWAWSEMGNAEQAELAAALDDRDRLAKARAILFASTDNEATSHPWWAIVRNGSFGRMVVLAGPFFSRESATAMLVARRYDWGEKAYVFCYSAYYAPDYKELREALKPAIASARGKS